MSHVDYMKVIDIAAASLKPGTAPKVNAVDIQLYAAEVEISDNASVKFQIRIGDYNLDFTIEKDNLPSKEFSKWVKVFEYQLEQNFFRNIKVSFTENSDEYRMSVMF